MTSATEKLMNVLKIKYYICTYTFYVCIYAYILGCGGTRV